MISEIPVVDLFAGPGGLGEGFSVFRYGGAQVRFKVVLSIEKEEVPHRTLELRSFFRQFAPKEVPEEYYAYLRREISRDKLFSRFPAQAKAAREIAWQATLGTTPNEKIDSRIKQALNGAKDWVLIGGPPCQAYSMAGRSRNGGIKESDTRADLYREYLRIIAKFHPSIFIMENVKGLLSAQKNETSIFQNILRDLSCPVQTQNKRTLPSGACELGYDIFSMVKKPRPEDDRKPGYSPQDFVIRCEDYGIPQARHRIILLGAKKASSLNAPQFLRKRKTAVSCRSVISGLPRLRGGTTEVKDCAEAWQGVLRAAIDEPWLKQVSEPLREAIVHRLSALSCPRCDRGGEFIFCSPSIGYLKGWYLDSKLGGVANHASKGHLNKDLYRYFFAASYALKSRKSPYLKDFPPLLYPEHKNVSKSLEGSNFPDRFRVQLFSRPATTITSHIAKDGHYYIHPDATQCRSLSVREAARIQTFPDNYFFEGCRTEQYHQVGNAVPPFLAFQIAKVVAGMMEIRK